jgi:NAD-dependent dihydropyrimidine dehydrogenase PreA subunit
MSILQNSTRRRKQLLVERKEIAWYPVIDLTICNGCGECAAFCKPGVFEPGATDPNGVLRQRMQVANPYLCHVLCTRCLPVCPSGAISLPDPNDFEKFVQYVEI